MKLSSVLAIEGFDDLFGIEPEQVKWDFNLSRLPYFAPGQKKADRFRDLVIRETIKQPDGNTIEVSWEVRHDHYLGLPSGFDRDVWIGILQAVNEVTENGKGAIPDQIDIGPVYRFLKRIGKGTDGRNIKMLRESIERLATTGCLSKGSFNCPSSGGYVYMGEVFHLIRAWGFKGEPKTGGGVHETNFVILDPLIKKNLDSFYVSILRVDFMRGLKGEITKLLYPLLSYRFWKARQNKESGWRVHWRELVSYIALKGVGSLKRAKDRLKGAFEELTLKEYISDESAWDGDYYTFYPGAEYVREHQQKVLARDNYQAKKVRPTHKIGSFPAVKPVWHGSQNDPDQRGTEIGYQVWRLATGQDLKLERLEELNISPDEVYEALEKSKR